MDKLQIVEFLLARKRNAYVVLVRAYVDVITSVGPSMALDIITKDLEKETGRTVTLNYCSLAQAIARHKKNIPASPAGKATWEFKDAYELEKSNVTPGSFRLDTPKPKH